MSLKITKKEGFDKFNPVRGNGVVLLEGNRMASLSETILTNDVDGFVFSEQPISLESAFTVRISEMRHFGPPISFGFTAVPPNDVIRMKSWKELYLSQKFWYIDWNNVCFNAEEQYFQNALKLMQLTVGDTIGCRVTSKGEFIVLINNVTFSTRCTDVPTNCLLWGWMNIDTKVVSITSQFQSGLVILRYMGRPYISSSSTHQQYLCALCKDLPSSVQKMKCCGKVCCRECYRDGSTCQSCNLKVELVSDALLEQKIQAIQVFCPNAGKGCSCYENMPLTSVIHHRCKFQGIYQCEPESGDTLEKKQKITLEAVRTKLKSIRGKKTSGELALVNSVSDSNNQSVERTSTSSSVSDAQSQVCLPSSEQTAVFDFLVPSVTTKDRNNALWTSKPFLTFDQGYKLSIGISFGSNYFNYVSAHLHAGEFDTALKWPFTATLRCELLKVDGTVYHTSLRYLTPSEGGRVESNYTKRILLFSLYDDSEDYWLPGRFDLVYKKCMENDSLKFRLTVTDFPAPLL